MPHYQYKGYSADGRTVKGYIDAENIREAREKLRTINIFPIKLEEGFEKGSREKLFLYFSSLKNITARVSLRELSAFTREFGTLIKAGLPVVNSLNALLEQFENPYFKFVIADVRDKVTEGYSLADAMRPHRKVFSELYVSMVGAGETAGTLEGILFTLADYIDDIVRFRSKLVTIAIYPSIVFTVMIGVLIILLGFVIPRVSRIFEDLGHTLPFYTKVIIAFSHFIKNFWPLLLLFCIALFAGYHFYRRTKEGKKKIDILKLNLPVLGKFVKLSLISRFSRTLSTLLKGGVSILRSLEIVEDIVGNEVLKEAVREIKESIAGGSSFSEPLRKSGIFPPVVIHMVSAGEKSGELENMLLKVSEIFDQELETMTNAFIAVLEPLIVIMMAGMVLFIILSVLLPLLQLQQFIK